MSAQPLPHILPPLAVSSLTNSNPNMPPMMHTGIPTSQPTPQGPTSNADHTVHHQHAAGPRPPPPPLDTMRAYRACLNCRNRKSKCDLDSNQGRPPCRRCQRENRECVLGESHRGGRRVRKKPKLDESAPSTPVVSSIVVSSTDNTPQYAPVPLPGLRQLPAPSSEFQNRYGWQQPPKTSGSDATNALKHTEHTHLTSLPIEQHYQSRLESVISVSGKPEERVYEGIASADLQNPSDALEILARVAERADDDNASSRSDQTHSASKDVRPPPSRQIKSPPRMDGYWHYKPIQNGLITPEEVYSLISSYERFFHPYFPIIPTETFDQSRLPWLSKQEPHLFSAILAVASKDNERQHQICYDHMQLLISDILAGADANVEAVEALLLLSQWVSHQPQVSVTVGRGEEDRVAWMYIGTALRLGYFLGIDRTSFKSDSQEDPALFNRKRLVWTACYICDRQVSVRVGKGFWARGPGPLSGLRSSDFPTLQPMSQHDDNYAEILQANLELTQIFSNVHDILYSSKGHGWKEMLEGRYAKYLDDFRTSIRNWYDIWGSYICSSRLKSSLLLTYDYLRLYVNAFAYQATISRALTFQRDGQYNPHRRIPLIDATAPDARFIYEALDAAKSLLSNFNLFVDPDILRCMPSSYYLFIIYSAVFLYKARSTTTMTDDERINVRYMITQTIQRLERASQGANQMGNRYARLLKLLWRKSPARAQNPAPRSSTHICDPTVPNKLNPNSNLAPNQNLAQNFDYSTYSMGLGNGMAGGMGGGNEQGNGGQGQGQGFSWLDLSATCNYATQNGHSSGASQGELTDDGGLVGGNETSPFDMGNLNDYSLLDGDNPNLIF